MLRWQHTNSLSLSMHAYFSFPLLYYNVLFTLWLADCCCLLCRCMRVPLFSHTIPTLVLGLGPRVLPMFDSFFLSFFCLPSSFWEVGVVVMLTHSHTILSPLPHRTGLIALPCVSNINIYNIIINYVMWGDVCVCVCSIYDLYTLKMNMGLCRIPWPKNNNNHNNMHSALYLGCVCMCWKEERKIWLFVLNRVYALTLQNTVLRSKCCDSHLFMRAVNITHTYPSILSVFGVYINI